MKDTVAAARAGRLAPRWESVRLSEMETELHVLFHRLNNQLGIILAHAELLEAKVSDDANRSRAAQIVTSTLEAMGTAKEIRRRGETEAESSGV